MGNRRGWTVVLASAWLAGACSGQVASPAGPEAGSLGPTSPPASAPATGTQRGRALAGRPLTSCVIAGEVPVKAEHPALCGVLEVPEDRANPAGRRVPLNVAVVPAGAADPAPDPLFALAGGPGDASTQFFAWLPDVYADVHATRDIVLVDQRGTGQSNAMTLAEMPDTTGLGAPEADAALADWAATGLAAHDADPRFYTSGVAADDLDDVRAALGYDRIDLYGTSYGGELAQYYLRQHGDHVRAAVIDGSTPLDVPVWERMAANSQAALDLLLRRCAADAACGTAFPRLADEWSTLQRGLEHGITTDVVNPETGQHAVADLVTIGPSLHHALLMESTAAQLPLALHLASEGRWVEATGVVPGVSTGGESLVMFDEIMCSEAWTRFDAGEVSRLGAGSYLLPSELADAAARAAMCGHLPKGTVPADDAAAVRTTVPILWLAGDGDPQDPPANLASIPEQQPNSLVVVMPAQEHVVGHLGCGPALIARFLDAGTSAGLDATCAARGADPAPTFRLP